MDSVTNGFGRAVIVALTALGTYACSDGAKPTAAVQTEPITDVSWNASESSTLEPEGVDAHDSPDAAGEEVVEPGETQVTGSDDGASVDGDDAKPAEPKGDEDCPEVYRKKKKLEGYLLSCGSVTKMARAIAQGKSPSPLESTFGKRPFMTQSSSNFCKPSDFSNYPDHRLTKRQYPDQRLQISVSSVTVCAPKSRLTGPDETWPKFHGIDAVGAAAFDEANKAFHDLCPGAKDRSEEVAFRSFGYTKEDGETFLCTLAIDEIHAESGGLMACPSRCAEPSDPDAIGISLMVGARYDGYNVPTDIDKVGGTSKVEVKVP